MAAACTSKVLGALLMLTAAVAVQACTPECTGCNAYGPYWSGQGCGDGSNQVFTKTMPDGTDHTACCAACAKSKCCLFWVYQPDSLECQGYSNCNRIDGQNTVREWLGDWKVLPKSCPGYSPHPDAEIAYPGLHDPNDAPWPVGENPPVLGN
ncbi:hypothetical protein KFL_007590020 [Klebsormidium nitens]|uniref:Apple domain-containing protein n=1 Tax=Klebsormidium nitens TaxID=105231 RepID=A0A1Y1ISX8_KLENI|nr:hypothetical protein KFL_007590020 [Klebsormidium nitens]|eukprot:GAQ91288.1 hypothetical protein KFL_007590020 [Klebsormidium nitens]